MVVSKNNYLTLEEMTVNAEYIMSYFLSKGWSNEAISGMLGNMQTESTINAGIWQNLDEGNLSLGVGLVQWTPATKLTEWASSVGLDFSQIDTQLKRIEYEVANGIQWGAVAEYPMSFTEFIVSRETPEYLAQVFLKNYEKPSNQNQPNRSTQARYWFDTLSGESSGGSKPAFPTSAGLPITSHYGYRGDIGVHGASDYHWASDIGSGGMTDPPIYATQKGVVDSVGTYSNGAVYVFIKHTGDPYWSRYLHLKSYSVSVGQVVAKGEQIGIMGNTRRTTQHYKGC